MPTTRTAPSIRSDGTAIGKARATDRSRPARRRGFLPAIRPNVAWACDLHLDRKGHPYLAYSVTKDREGSDHRYRYARWDGDRWHDREIAYAGSRLYPGEVHYTGNVALNPQNPDELYISTNVDPARRPAADEQRRRQAPLGNLPGRHPRRRRHLDLDAGDGQLDGRQPSADRAHRRHDRTLLLWMRGSYATYCEWETQAVGQFR